MKYVADRRYADPETSCPQAAGDRQQRRGGAGRSHLYREDQLPFLFVEATAAEYKAGLDLAIARGWLELHESGTYVRFTQAGADLFA
jgi:hypothetical protein